MDTISTNYIALSQEEKERLANFYNDVNTVLHYNTRVGVSEDGTFFIRRKIRTYPTRTRNWSVDGSGKKSDTSGVQSVDCGPVVSDRTKRAKRRSDEKERILGQGIVPEYFEQNLEGMLSIRDIGPHPDDIGHVAVLVIEEARNFDGPKMLHFENDEVPGSEVGDHVHNNDDVLQFEVPEYFEQNLEGMLSIRDIGPHPDDIGQVAVIVIEEARNFDGPKMLHFENDEVPELEVGDHVHNSDDDAVQFEVPEYFEQNLEGMLYIQDIGPHSDDNGQVECKGLELLWLKVREGRNEVVRGPPRPRKRSSKAEQDDKMIGRSLKPNKKAKTSSADASSAAELGDNVTLPLVTCHICPLLPCFLVFGRCFSKLPTSTRPISRGYIVDEITKFLRKSGINFDFDSSDNDEFDILWRGLKQLMLHLNGANLVPHNIGDQYYLSLNGNDMVWKTWEYQGEVNMEN